MPPMNPNPVALSLTRGSPVRVRKASKWLRCAREFWLQAKYSVAPSDSAAGTCS